MSERTPDWTAYEAAAAEALPLLDPFVGVWTGAGQAHGAPLRGRLVVERILQGSAVLHRETLWKPDGSLDYEDLAIYRCDPEGGLFVQHFQAPGWAAEARVQALEGGVAWVTTPLEPRVELRREGPDLTVSVWFAFQPTPASQLRYRRETP